ncbi:glycosyltransferase family A protein [Microbulbifer bruguierae]|uniref:Glycosyltransferase family A protein n=1 Tax=Microbulbifer bruguierae TaxID=3029061 RepID=A0ABY8N8M5_9GAMM|nr:glycosyltransferase family A protein [Microbulbifer bruguierae]WGL15254.1 glycosyltransferase family A protein [Microbulbifer bruguierae]
MDNRDYLIISPCRDEAEYMERTLNSVVSQSVLPKLWLIVDDGSTDDSPEILKRYSSRYPFIKILTRKNRGFRSVGPGVVDTFYAGYRTINLKDYSYICKLDLDLELPHRYFEILIKKMEDDARIGTCSGKPYNLRKGRLISERRGDEMSVGMTKFYRTSCFEQIGGFVREVMWDAIDCHKCRQLGWRAISWDEPELKFIHLRVMGSSHQGVLTGRARHGFGQYFMGTGWLYMLTTCAFRAVEYPIIVGGFAMFFGYLRAAFQSSPTLDDEHLVREIKQFQWKSLFAGKKAATKYIEKKNSSKWFPKNLEAGRKLLKLRAEPEVEINEFSVSKSEALDANVNQK